MTIQDNQKEFRVDGCAVTPGTFYAAACDPKRSVAVVACAGAGKTWILVSRIVRALLEGTKPQEILAITYTRKAAGEMRGRLEEFLSSMASPLTTDEERVKALMDRGLGRAEAAAACEQLRSLYARVLNYGRAIEVSTFHAWFARMLKAAPREVLEEIGVTNDVSLVEDVEELRPDLMAKFRETVSADEALSDDLGRVVARHGRSQVERWLDAALDKRVELELADKHDTLMDSVPSLGDGFPEFAALVSPSEYLLGDAGRDLIGSVAAELGMSKNSTPKKAAEGLEAAMSAASGAHALAAAKSAVLTKSCTVRAHLKAQRLDELAEVIARVDDAQQQVSAREDHQRMVRLSRAMLRDYGEYKRDRGLADMADLETVAQRLLSDATLAGWVQERLDARVRHVLVDEFQDTNPLQWRALASWLSAYAGSGGGAERPSVFLVGDPKQSIYRFRRAEPRVFAAAQRFVRETLNGVVLECNHTRRNAPEVVGALNGVFGVAKANGEFDGFASHTTEAGASGERHLGMTGIVLLDPVGRGEGRGAGVEVSGGWRPSLTEPRRGAEVVARAAEARKVALAIADLVRQGTRARDVMVLSRKRAGLVLVQQELEALDIKFEEAEARPLGDCAEVQDLLAAMDAVVSHTNDVAVARILKSPMFGVSDEALLFMAGARRLSGWRWFSLLQDKERIEAGAPEGDVEKLHRAGAALSALSREAKELPPHDLLDAILARTGYAERCMAVLSPDRRVAAAKAIDALLSKALALNGGRYSTPYAFVRELRAKTVKHPSTAGEGGVRLLTVHGAKGLEAPVVFIIDTQPEAKRVESASVLVRWEVEDQAPAMCAFVTSKPPSSLALIAKAETALQRREEMNGLYVALTRAAELVVVSSTEPYAYDKEGVSWWDRIYDHAARWSVDEEAAADAWKAHQAASGVAVEDVATLRLPSLGERAQGAVKVAGAMMQSRFKDGGYAANFGHTVHRVMEWCTPTTVSPGLDRTEAAAVERLAADACVENFLPPSESAVVAAQCRSMLDAPVLAKLLVDGNWKWAGNEVTLSGDPRSMRADRMVCFDEGGLETWWVLDYKRDVQPQEREEYVSQLLGYRALVQRMVGSKSKVMAAFITGGSELRVIDGVRTSLDGAGEGQAVATAEVA